MKKIKQKVRYEFYSFQTGPTGVFNTTLVLENPASVKFILTGNGGVTDICTINNAYNLQPVGIFTSAIGANFPCELILENNENEIDITNYSINITSPANSINLKVVAKYYID
jgi:hypothetical protein